MEKKKNVFLFGAGAVLDWKAPSTYELTKLTRDSGFYTTDNKTRITEFIYAKLKEANYSDGDINFETIINVIEELIVYYSSFDAKQKLPSISNIILGSKFEEELLNFSVEDNKTNHGFKLEIPKGKRSEFAKSAINNETPAQFFFQQLLSKIITNIVGAVSKYSYHTKGHSTILVDENKEINQLFYSWIDKVKNTGVLRMYSLNYDRNFKVILENANKDMTIFEGFDCNQALEYGSRLSPNVLKILNDFECDIYYNLHGSASWGIEVRDCNQLPNPTFYLKEAPFFMDNSHELPIWQSEKGKTIILTNIITGYQKTQKGIFPPFKQMQSAFDKDCCLADNLYIIGYSFNDEHINASIRTAVQYNENLKITIVDPSFTKLENDFIIATKIFSLAGDMRGMKAKTIEKDLHSFYGTKFTIHNRTFKDFLSLG